MLLIFFAEMFVKVLCIIITFSYKPTSQTLSSLRRCFLTRWMVYPRVNEFFLNFLSSDIMRLSCFFYPQHISNRE